MNFPLIILLKKQKHKKHPSSIQVLSALLRCKAKFFLINKFIDKNSTLHLASYRGSTCCLGKNTGLSQTWKTRDWTRAESNLFELCRVLAGSAKPNSFAYRRSMVLHRCYWSWATNSLILITNNLILWYGLPEGSDCNKQFVSRTIRLIAVWSTHVFFSPFFYGVIVNNTFFP